MAKLSCISEAQAVMLTIFRGVRGVPAPLHQCDRTELAQMERVCSFQSAEVKPTSVAKQSALLYHCRSW